MKGMPRAAPTSYEAEWGRGTACSDGTTVYSAAVPVVRPRAAWNTHTLWPTRVGSTPSPTASTTPAPSWLGVCAGPTIGIAGLDRDFQSVGLTPDTWTRTRTSPGPGSGVGTSTTRRTSWAAPWLVYTAARIAPPPGIDPTEAGG